MAAESENESIVLKGNRQILGLLSLLLILFCAFFWAGFALGWNAHAEPPIEPAPVGPATPLRAPVPLRFAAGDRLESRTML